MKMLSRHATINILFCYNEVNRALNFLQVIDYQSV